MMRVLQAMTNQYLIGQWEEDQGNVYRIRTRKSERNSWLYLGKTKIDRFQQWQLLQSKEKFDNASKASKGQYSRYYPELFGHTEKAVVIESTSDEKFKQCSNKSKGQYKRRRPEVF